MGCYYLTCKKYEAAQKYLQVATKVGGLPRLKMRRVGGGSLTSRHTYPPSFFPDSAGAQLACLEGRRPSLRALTSSPPPPPSQMDKRFARAWVALGLSLSLQEESEHAIAAFRAACRCAPV